MAVHFIPTVRWYYIAVVKLLSDCLSTLSIDAIHVPTAVFNSTVDHITEIHSKTLADNTLNYGPDVNGPKQGGK